MSGQEVAQLEYPLRMVGRKEFASLYETRYPRPERGCAAARWEQRQDAVYTHLVTSWRLVRARGQHCRTTNGQRMQALEERSCSRSRRSVQYYNDILRELGIMTVSHLRRPPGVKDCQVIEWRCHRSMRAILKSRFAPPLRERRTLPPGVCSPLDRQRPTDLIPLASRAETEPPDKPAERPASEEERREARIRFLEMKLAYPFGDMSEIKLELARLQRGANLDLHPYSTGTSAQAAETAVTTARGFRCST